MEMVRARQRYGLLLTALAPVVPQILWSAFNVWYNTTVIQPLLTPALKQRFLETVVLYNSVAYPCGVFCGSDEFSRFASCSIAFVKDHLSILHCSGERAGG